MASLLVLALCLSSCDVVAGGLVAGHADDGDAPKGSVGLPVAAAVEPEPVLDLAAVDRYGAGADVGGE